MPSTRLRHRNALELAALHRGAKGTSGVVLTPASGHLPAFPFGLMWMLCERERTGSRRFGFVDFLSFCAFVSWVCEWNEAVARVLEDMIKRAKPRPCGAASVGRVVCRCHSSSFCGQVARGCSSRDCHSDLTGPLRVQYCNNYSRLPPNAPPPPPPRRRPGWRAPRQEVLHFVIAEPSSRVEHSSPLGQA